MLHVEDAERVRLVTLDRPEARNALDTEHYDGLADLPTGAEDRTEHGFLHFVTALESFPKPLVAAVNGVAVGLGVTMLPYCDLVLIAEDARLRTPFASLGVVPEAGGSFTLPTAMGRQTAGWALLTGAWIDAATAHASGLAWRVCAPDRLLGDALDVARAMARLPIVSLVETKRLLRTGWTEAARSARAREEAVFARLTGAPANREAIAAFLEKRDPDFVRLPSE